MDKTRFQTTGDWVGFVTWTLETIAAIVCHVFALMLFIKQKNIGVSDLLVAHLCGCEFVSVITEYVTMTLYYWKQIDWKHNYIDGPIVLALFVMCYLSIVSITLDRVLVVLLALKYKMYVAKKKVVIVFCTIWFVSIGMGLFHYFTDNEEEIYLFFDLTIIIVIITSYSYISIAVLVRRRAIRRNGSQSNSVNIRYQIPLCIVITFVVTIFVPDLILLVRPDFYSVWIEVIWTLNWISDPLAYVILT